MLKISHISKTFNPGTVNERKALSDLSLELADGDFATIVGSNGAGKSTLFNAIAGTFIRMMALSSWMDGILRSKRNMYEAVISAVFFRIR